jgi:membrane-associated protein
MNYYKFLSANFVGATVWGVGMTFVGFYAAQIPAVRNVAYIIGISFITLSVVAGLRAWLKDRKLTRSIKDNDLSLTIDDLSCDVDENKGTL